MPLDHPHLPRPIKKSANPVPKFDTVPRGLPQVRQSILKGVTSTQLLRAAAACRNGATVTRNRITTGNAAPKWVPTMEDQVVDLVLMEGVLRTMAGAFREIERQERQRLDRALEAAQRANGCTEYCRGDVTECPCAEQVRLEATRVS